MLLGREYWMTCFYTRKCTALLPSCTFSPWNLEKAQGYHSRAVFQNHPETIIIGSKSSGHSMNILNTCSHVSHVWVMSFDQSPVYIYIYILVHTCPITKPWMVLLDCIRAPKLDSTVNCTTTWPILICRATDWMILTSFWLRIPNCTILNYVEIRI